LSWSGEGKSVDISDPARATRAGANLETRNGFTPHDRIGRRPDGTVDQPRWMALRKR